MTKVNKNVNELGDYEAVKKVNVAAAGLFKWVVNTV